MSAPAVDYESLIPLFPLPNLVLFPGVVQPLHVFEPRYRQMMVYALARQKVLAIALLQPGWEEGYYGRPPIHEIVCVGRIIAHEMVADGNYNLLLQGVARARVRAEQRERQFRVAQLEPVLVPDPDPARDEEQRAGLAQLVTRGSLARLAISKTLRELFEQDAPTGLIVDALAFSALSDMTLKQRLLELASPSCRAALLLSTLRAIPAVEPERAWPPPPGMN